MTRRDESGNAMKVSVIECMKIWDRLNKANFETR